MPTPGSVSVLFFGVCSLLSHTDEDERLRDRLLVNEPGALQEFMLRMEQTFLLEIRRVCRSWQERSGREVRMAPEDLLQDIYLALFANKCKTLRSWEPGKGRSLKNFLAWFARQQVRSVLRKRKTNAAPEDPLPMEEVGELQVDGDLTKRLELRDLVRQVFAKLRQDLPPDDMRILEMLFIEELSVEDVCARVSATPMAIYQRKSRLLKKAHDVLQKFEGIGELKDKDQG